jgi:lysozyme
MNSYIKSEKVSAKKYEQEKRMNRKITKKFMTCLMAATITVGSYASPVMANPHYDRRDTVAEEEMVPAAGGAAADKGRSKVNAKAWKKINGVCYNGSGKVIPGAITRGIDVSEWQGNIDWTKVKKSDIDFAFVRISYGLNHYDYIYESNMIKAEQAGVPVGTYVYSTALSAETALKEAQYAIEKMQGYKVSYPVVFDLEYAKASNLSPKKVSQMALAFCNEVRKAGYYPMVYCNTNWYDNYIDWSLLSGIDVWIARYGDTIQAPDKDRYNYTIWQCTDGNTESGLNSTSGLVAGIPAGNDVDVNFGYVDYTKKVTPRKEQASDYVPSKKPVVSNGQDKIESGLYEEDEKYYFIDEDGDRVSDKWETINGKTYYFGTDGYALKGMKKVDGKYYWFNKKYCYMYENRRVTRANGDIYYFGSDGVRYESGMTQVNENGKVHTYYFQKNGKAYKGWLTLEGKKYYFFKGSSAVSGTRAENITLTSSRKVVSVFNSAGVCMKQYKKK